MREIVQREYLRLRRKDWRASEAWRAAKVNVAWDEAEANGLVKLEADVDECTYIEDLDPCGTPEQQAETMRIAERDGVWVYTTFYLDPVDGFIPVDSIGGVIGELKDDGYDVELKRAALEALENIDVAMCEGWV